MSNDEIFEKVKKVIVEGLDVEEEKVELSSAFIDDFGADSLDIVELVMSLEEEFGISIEDQDAEKLATVEDVVKYIESKIK